MIKLYSRTNLRDPQTGTSNTFDLEALQKDLRHAFQTSGISETWMADHILLTLTEQCRAHTSETEEDDTDATIDFLVSRMLIDAGYPDVAHAFGRIRQLDTPGFETDTRPW